MSVTISTKVPEELQQKILDEMEEGENRSACVRRLVRAGLDDADRPPGVYVTRWAVAVLIGWFLVIGAFGSFERYLGYVGLAVIVAGVLHAGADRLGILS